MATERILFCANLVWGQRQRYELVAVYRFSIASMPCPKEIRCDLNLFVSRDCFCRSSTHLMVGMKIESPGRDHVRVCRNNRFQNLSQSSFTTFQTAVRESKADDMLRVHAQLG